MLRTILPTTCIKNVYLHSCFFFVLNIINVSYYIIVLPYYFLIGRIIEDYWDREGGYIHQTPSSGYIRSIVGALHYFLYRAGAEAAERCNVWGALL